jgi:hypothetical protein
MGEVRENWLCLESIDKGVRIQETEQRMRLRHSHHIKAWWSEATSFVILTSEF